MGAPSMGAQANLGTILIKLNKMSTLSLKNDSTLTIVVH